MDLSARLRCADATVLWKRGALCSGTLGVLSFGVLGREGAFFMVPGQC